MAKNEHISMSVVRRLPRYYRFLYDLKENGVTRISSRELSQRMGLTASQIRQDLNCFGGFGQQGYGYMVEQLYNEIGHILGMDRLAELIAGKVSAFTGNSGVGKSSILNYLEPGFRLQVGAVSDKLGRGRHTTRHVELYQLSSGAIVADTPGFSSFDTERMELVRKEDLEHAFREFQPYLGQCRFTGCAHVKEKGCAVRAALAEGRIPASRHESYVRLYEQAKEHKAWELPQT